MKIRWANGGVPRRCGDEHFLAVGASGSGKSTLINHVLHTVLSDPGVRALVYDPKQELLPQLFGLRGVTESAGRLSSSVKVLHPFDVRATGWDMAADIDGPIAARQLATILVPQAEQGGSAEGFFNDAVRDVLTGVLLAFIECVPNAGVWTFRDVLLALLYEPYLDLILGLSKTRGDAPFPTLQRIRATYFGPDTDERTRANIQASLSVRLAVYEPVAAAWHRAQEAADFGGTFSLKGWMAEIPSAASPGTVLVLGNDEAARAALDPINQALFKRATEVALARRERTPEERETGDNQVWFFLDEVREAGRLDGLGRLLTKGRSKNVCVTMGFQDIDGMREVYGKELANELCAQFNNVAVLRVNSPETAQWASDLFGRRLDAAKGRSSGMSSGGEGTSMSLDESRSEQELPFLYTETFLHGANAAAARAVVGHRKGPDQEIPSLTREQARARFRFEERTEARIAPKDLARRLRSSLPPEAAERAVRLSVPLEPRPVNDQYLAPWMRKDFERLGLPGEPPSLTSEERPAETGAAGKQTVNYTGQETTFQQMADDLRRRSERRQ